MFTAMALGAYQNSWRKRVRRARNKSENKPVSKLRNNL